MAFPPESVEIRGDLPADPPAPGTPPKPSAARSQFPRPEVQWIGKPPGWKPGQRRHLPLASRQWLLAAFASIGILDTAIHIVAWIGGAL